MVGEDAPVLAVCLNESQDNQDNLSDEDNNASMSLDPSHVKQEIITNEAI
jgi:hypothetical protein